MRGKASIIIDYLCDNAHSICIQGGDTRARLLPARHHHLVGSFFWQPALLCWRNRTIFLVTHIISPHSLSFCLCFTVSVTRSIVIVVISSESSQARGGQGGFGVTFTRSQVTSGSGGDPRCPPFHSTRGWTAWWHDNDFNIWKNWKIICSQNAYCKKSCRCCSSLAVLARPDQARPWQFEIKNIINRLPPASKFFPPLIIVFRNKWPHSRRSRLANAADPDCNDAAAPYWKRIQNPQCSVSRLLQAFGFRWLIALAHHHLHHSSDYLFFRGDWEVRSSSSFGTNLHNRNLVIFDGMIGAVRGVLRRLFLD